MARESLRLSKSRFLAGLQCHKQLWWRVHEPDAPELVPDAGHRNILNQGNEVGRKAREYVPGGTLVDLPFHQFDNKVARTREVLQCDPAPPAIYEATFLADETYAAVDILERGPRGYGLVEVKATNSLKPEHLPDVAIQVHVLRRAGLPVERAEVMHLNRDCRYPDLGNLFVREDVSAPVEGVLLGVSDELAAFPSPLAFLDFETVSLAIPRWNGCRPWQNVPVQFSCHVEERGRGLVHHEWLADGPGDRDPRPALAEALVAACAGARRIVAYYASFERECVRQLAAAVPRLAPELERIERRLVDLLPLIRNYVYHPDFGGSFSIKRTLPALVPGLSYADLKIREGETATLELMRLLFTGDELPPGARADLREALLRYCERDTWAMVRMLEQLRGLVAQQLELF